MPLAADAQRERTVGTLRRAYVEGRLATEEFEDRTGRALQARTTGELRALVRDLPWLDDLLSGARDVAKRLVLLAALGLFWSVASLVLLVAFLAAMVSGGMSGGESLVFLLTWVVLTWAVWRAARH
jgi:hypothetical protein